MKFVRGTGLMALVLVVFSSCSANHDARQQTPSPRSSPTAAPSAEALPAPAAPSPFPVSPTRAGLLRAKVRLIKVVSMKDPMAIATRPGDPTIYVGQRKGVVWSIRDGTLDPTPVLDISQEVSFGGDLGLLGMTFSPDGSWLYVDYTDDRPAVRVVAWPFLNGGVVARRARNIITIPQPSPVHHAGAILFDLEGDLWISTGDGEGEAASETATTSQSTDSLLGKLIRIIPTPSAKHPYRIPPTNPFIGQADARPEVFAYGLRNPWRFSFDRATGDLWIADVGRYRMEEIDFLAAGVGAGTNFGWNRLEGTLPLTGSPPARSVMPLYEYPHTNGRCAVMGGYVYRGPSIPGLDGAYVYADWCEGVLRAIVERNGRFAFGRSLGVRLPGTASFGEGPDGALYALSLSRGVFRLEADAKTSS